MRRLVSAFVLFAAPFTLTTGAEAQKTPPIVAPKAPAARAPVAPAAELEIAPIVPALKAARVLSTVDLSALMQRAKPGAVPDLAAAVTVSVAQPVQAGQAALTLQNARSLSTRLDGSAQASLAGAPADLAIPDPPGGDDASAQVSYARRLRRYLAQAGGIGVTFVAKAGAVYVVDCEIADGAYVWYASPTVRGDVASTDGRLTFAFLAATGAEMTLRLFRRGTEEFSFRSCRVVPQR